MKRKEFLKTCGIACLGVVASGTLLQGCSSNLVTGTIVGDQIVVPLKEFEKIKGDDISFKRYLVIQNERLQYPISVYRLDDDRYTALLMKCSHQGTELTAYGDKLHCSAHGSEFDKEGNVTNGPAENHLRVFPTLTEDGVLKISIKSS